MARFIRWFFSLFSSSPIVEQTPQPKIHSKARERARNLRNKSLLPYDGPWVR